MRTRFSGRRSNRVKLVITIKKTREALHASKESLISQEQHLQIRLLQFGITKTQGSESFKQQLFVINKIRFNLIIYLFHLFSCEKDNYIKTYYDDFYQQK